MFCFLVDLQLVMQRRAPKTVRIQPLSAMTMEVWTAVRPSHSVSLAMSIHYFINFL